MGPNNKPIIYTLVQSEEAAVSTHSIKNLLKVVLLFAVVFIPAVFVLTKTSLSPTGEQTDYKNLTEQQEDEVITNWQTGTIWNSAGVHSIATVKLFLDTRTDVNAREPDDGTTAMHSAASFGRLDMIKFLLSRGANPNIRAFNNESNPGNQHGKVPLHSAAAGTKTDVVEFLLGLNGSDVNVKDARGWTPLHYAASNNILDGMDAMIKVLLKAGADPNIKNNDGKTALDVAKEENQNFDPPQPVNPEIVELLSLKKE